MKTIFRFKKGKGIYGNSNTQIAESELLDISNNSEMVSYIENYVNSNTHYHSNFSVLNSITQQDINNWDKNQFTQKEEETIRIGMKEIENVYLYHLYNKSSIPTIPAAESIIVLKNYNNSFNDYILVRNSTISTSIYHNLMINNEILKVYYKNSTSYVSFRIGRTNDITVQDFTCLKRLDGNINDLVPNTDGKTSQRMLTIGLKPVNNNSSGTDLSNMPAPDKITIESSTGTNTDIPTVTDTNAGLQKPDFYKEGDFNPTIETSANDGSYTYTVNTARYTRIGNLVHFEIDISNINTSVLPPSNNSRFEIGISDLPHTAYAKAFSIAFFYGGNKTFSNIEPYLSTTNRIAFNTNNSNSTGFTTPIFQLNMTNGGVRLSGSYITNVYTP